MANFFASEQITRGLKLHEPHDFLRDSKKIGIWVRNSHKTQRYFFYTFTTNKQNLQAEFKFLKPSRQARLKIVQIQILDPRVIQTMRGRGSLLRRSNQHPAQKVRNFFRLVFLEFIFFQEDVPERPHFEGLNVSELAVGGVELAGVGSGKGHGEGKGPNELADLGHVI
jgi:hypothetical protein